MSENVVTPTVAKAAILALRWTAIAGVSVDAPMASGRTGLMQTIDMVPAISGYVVPEPLDPLRRAVAAYLSR